MEVIGPAAKRVAGIAIRAKVGAQPDVGLAGSSSVPVLCSENGVAQPGEVLCQTVPATPYIRGISDRGVRKGDGRFRCGRRRR